MSILDQLQGQASALDDYQNKYDNAMNSFNLEKQMSDASDLAFTQAKKLSSQVFNQQQLENLALAVPAVYGLTKSAYTRYKSGKPILPSKEEVTNSIKEFGQGAFEKGAGKAVNLAKKAVPDDVAKLYTDKYQGKIPQNLDELNEHLQSIKDFAKSKASTVVDQATDAAADAQSKVNDKIEATKQNLPLNFVDKDEGGAAPVSTTELGLQAAHNENFKMFSGFPENVKQIVSDRMSRMGVDDQENPDGSINPEKLGIQSDILAEAAGQYGVPQSKGFGGARGGRGFNSDLYYDPKIGGMVDRNSGEQITGSQISNFSTDTRSQAANYGRISEDIDRDESASFRPGASTLGRIGLPTTSTTSTIDWTGGVTNPTEAEHRSSIQQQSLERDPASFAPQLPAATRPAPAEPAPTVETGTGQRAGLDDLASRRDLKGPYGSTQAQGTGTGTEAPQFQLPQPQRRVRQRSAPSEESQTNVAVEQAKAAPPSGLEPSPSTAPPKLDPKEEPTEEPGLSSDVVEGAGGAAGGISAIGEGILTATDKDLSSSQKISDIGKEAGTIASFVAGGPILGGAVAASEILGSGETGAQKAKGIEQLGGTLGGAAAASALIPGAGELIMGAIGIAGLFHDASERKKQNAEEASQAPSAPRAPQAGGIAYDAAPVIDSSNFHEL